MVPFLLLLLLGVIMVKVCVLRQIVLEDMFSFVLSFFKVFVFDSVRYEKRI